MSIHLCIHPCQAPSDSQPNKTSLITQFRVEGLVLRATRHKAEGPVWVEPRGFDERPTARRHYHETHHPQPPCPCAQARIPASTSFLFFRACLCCFVATSLLGRRQGSIGSGSTPEHGLVVVGLARHLSIASPSHRTNATVLLLPAQPFASDNDDGQVAKARGDAPRKYVATLHHPSFQPSALQQPSPHPHPRPA